MRKCTAKKGEFSCTVWGSPWCKDCAKYKSVDIRPHYKNIEEALKVERPTDKVIKILSNKLAITQPMFENGKFASPMVMGIGKGTTVFSYGSVENIKTWCREVELKPNIRNISICYNFPENKKYGIWLMKVEDSRKYKQTYRKISKLIDNDN